MDEIRAFAERLLAAHQPGHPTGNGTMGKCTDGRIYAILCQPYGLARAMLDAMEPDA